MRTNANFNVQRAFLNPRARVPRTLTRPPIATKRSYHLSAKKAEPPRKASPAEIAFNRDLTGVIQGHQHVLSTCGLANPVERNQRRAFTIGHPRTLGLTKTLQEDSVLDFAPYILRDPTPEIVHKPEFKGIEILDGDNTITFELNLGVMWDKFFRTLRKIPYPNVGRSAIGLASAVFEKKNPYLYYHALGAEVLGGFKRHEIEFYAELFVKQVLLNPEFNRLHPVFYPQALAEIAAAMNANRLVMVISGSAKILWEKVFQYLPEYADKILKNPELAERLRSQNYVILGSTPKFSPENRDADKPSDVALNVASPPYTVLEGKYAVGRKWLEVRGLGLDKILRATTDSPADDYSKLCLIQPDREMRLVNVIPEQRALAEYLEKTRGVILTTFNPELIDELIKGSQTNYLKVYHQVDTSRRAVMRKIISKIPKELKTPAPMV